MTTPVPRTAGESDPPTAGRWVPAPAGPPGTPEHLRWYRDHHLIPGEWPVILRARALADAGRALELVALDREWGARIGPMPFAEASLRVGQRQLNRLRPLADLRVVQRYLAAVAAGRAHGWHPVVYGVVLSAFSLPLRQGLMHYAHRTLAGFAGAPDDDGLELPLPADLTDPMHPALQRLLGAPAGGGDAGLRAL